MRIGRRDPDRSPTRELDGASQRRAAGAERARSTTFALHVRAACTVLAATLAGCAHAPHRATSWLESAPAAARVERRAAEPMVCRQTKPTGSHVEKQVCLTPEDDRLQRDAARQILRAAATAPWRGR